MTTAEKELHQLLHVEGEKVPNGSIAIRQEVRAGIHRWLDPKAHVTEIVPEDDVTVPDDVERRVFILAPEADDLDLQHEGTIDIRISPNGALRMRVVAEEHSIFREDPALLGYAIMGSLKASRVKGTAFLESADTNIGTDFLRVAASRTLELAGVGVPDDRIEFASPLELQINHTVPDTYVPSDDIDTF